LILQNKILILVTGIGFILFNPGAACGQELSLRDALHIAIRNSQGVQIAKNNQAIAHIYNSYGVAGGLPLVNAIGGDNQQLTSIRQEYSNPANNKISNNAASNVYNAGVNATELVYNGFRVVTAKKRLGVTEEQAGQQLSSRSLTLIYNVTLKYFDIVRQQNYAGTLQSSITVSDQKLQIVQAQQKAGMANNADLFQAQVDLNTQKLNLETQELVVSQDKSDLLTLLNLNPDSTITIQDTILVDKTLRLDSVLNAVPNNPDIVAANQQVSINHYLEKEVGSQRYPSLSVGAGYNFVHTKNAAGFSLLNQSFGPYAGLTLAVPIFNGNIYKKQQQAAHINTSTAELQKDTLSLNYTSNIVKSWQAYNNNLKQLETAKENYDLALQLLNLLLLKFKLHQATIIDIRTAQESYENAGFQLVNISYAAKTAEVQLKRYANQLEY
jgi:outer membrane protein